MSANNEPIARANGIGGDEPNEKDDTCAASGVGCVYLPLGPEGEIQCRYCVRGASESESPKPEEVPKKISAEGFRQHLHDMLEKAPKPDAPEYHGGFMSPERAQQLESDLAAAREEVSQLQGWKDSAITVLSEWDAVSEEAQKCGPFPLGSKITDETLKTVKRLRGALEAEQAWRDETDLEKSEDLRITARKLREAALEGRGGEL